jgi:signal transduction histidine kinase
VTLSFRARLTLRWLIGFGLVLALALVATYVGIQAFLRRDLDAQLRTLAGTELASAVDEPGAGVHLHEFPVDQQNAADYAGKFVQLIDREGRILIQTPGLGRTPALVSGASLREAFDGRAPMLDVVVQGRSGRMTALTTQGSDRYLVGVGLFTDKLESALSLLRALLAAVWLGSLTLTAGLGYTLASRALVPISGITRRAAAIAQGQFSARLDEPTLQDEIGQMTHLLNEMLARLHGAIEANQRFAADASHELRSPLTAMLGEIEVTLKRERTGDEYREALSLLRARIAELGQLTEDLMLLVRAQERHETPMLEVSVPDTLRGVTERFAATAQTAGVTLQVSAPPGLRTYAEPRLLDRVLDNLVRNALQHSAQGDVVTVAGRLEPAAASAGWVADRAVITVCDEGPGIPVEERERVFDRFYRLDQSRSRRTGGTGLGLAISKEIVQLFKGTIAVADSGGRGTTIEVRLPGASLA